MLGHRKFDLPDYIGILRRRFVFIIIPIVIIPIFADVAARVLPPKYVSTALIFIERPKVTDAVVKPLSTNDLIERVAAIQEQVLSRARLEPVLAKYSPQPAGQPISEGAVDRLRKAIVIAPVEVNEGLAKSAADPPLPGLSISCTGHSAWAAQGICSDVTSMFIGESLEQQEQLEQGTTDFLSSQLAEAKRKLDEEDAKLADFKTRNLGRLPEDQSTNLSVLMETNTELEAASQAVDRATQDRGYAQSLLQQQLSSWEAATVSSSGGGPLPVDALQTQLLKMQQSLAQLQTQYTSSYPDVIKQKRAIADLEQLIKQKAATQSKTAATPASKPLGDRPEPLQIQHIRAQIQQDDEIIRTRGEEENRLRAQIAGYEQKLQLSPAVEAELKNLTRDHETALQFYNDLLAKKSQSGMQTALARGEQGERFRLLDAPNLPVMPDFPKRSLFLAGGGAGGLAAGLALAMLLEMLDKSIQDERDIEVLLKIPNLATVPTVKSLKGWQEKRPQTRAEEKSTVSSILTIKS